MTRSAMRSATSLLVAIGARAAGQPEGRRHRCASRRRRVPGPGPRRRQRSRGRGDRRTADAGGFRAAGPERAQSRGPCSVGIALYPDNGDSVETLMANADNAMYQAKASRQGSAIFFTEEMNIRLRERMQMEQDLNLAIELGQLALHFQPIFDIRRACATAAPRCCCAGSIPKRGSSARRLHSARRGHRPDRRRSATGSSSRPAAAGARGATPGSTAGFLAINISRIQFRKRFSKRLAELMATYGIPPHALELEITESVLLDDHHQVAEELRSLRALGVKFVARRFRYRLLVAELPQALPLRRAEDRPQLRRRPARQSRRRFARQGDPRHGEGTRPAGGRRRRGDTTDQLDFLDSAGLRLRAGLSRSRSP